MKITLKNSCCQSVSYVVKYWVMIRDYLKNKAKNLPQEPGIYIFKGLRGENLYVGKASNLKSRVSSYLKTEDIRIQKMVSIAHTLKHITTDSDIEALILESQLIKKLRPKFNIVMRDDKQYFYVLFTKDRFPKIFLTHQPPSNEDTIGPFTDGDSIKTTLRLLRRIFPFCTCKQLHHNYCLNYHIGKCLGVCCLKQQDAISNFQFPISNEYRKNIKAIKGILSGKKTSVIKDLEKEMKNLSKKREYERAIELQNQVEKLKRVFQNAQILRNTNSVIHNTENAKNRKTALKQLAQIVGLNRLPRRIEAYDIANIQGQHAVGVMVAFKNGESDRNKYRKFKIYTKDSPDDTAMLKEVLSRRFKHPEWQYPDLVLVDGGRGQLSAAIEATPRSIPVIALTKDDQHRGTKLYIQNREEAISLQHLPLSVRNLLLHLDSEAHRFAISYYRKLHRKTIKG